MQLIVASSVAVTLAVTEDVCHPLAPFGVDGLMEIVETDGRVLDGRPKPALTAYRLAEVLGELRETHDVVLIDSAPILAVSDTVPLLRYADATVIVGRPGTTTRDTAKRLREFAG